MQPISKYLHLFCLLLFIYNYKNRKAHIKQNLKLFDEAIIDYFAVLNKITNHIPTLKGKKILLVLFIFFINMNVSII